MKKRKFVIGSLSYKYWYVTYEKGPLFTLGTKEEASVFYAHELPVHVGQSELVKTRNPHPTTWVYKYKGMETYRIEEK